MASRFRKGAGFSLALIIAQSLFERKAPLKTFAGESPAAKGGKARTALKRVDSARSGQGAGGLLPAPALISQNRGFKGAAGGFGWLRAEAWPRFQLKALPGKRRALAGRAA